MRVLVVDQDSASNEAIARSLRDLYTVDAVTNKGDCLDLLRSNAFEVIVAAERLEDGSGLELLGQIGRKYPASLRIFAADKHRLQLLRGRLGPFQLFQTLAWPIDPDKLLATLELASAAGEEEESGVQRVMLTSEVPDEALEDLRQAAEEQEFEESSEASEPVEAGSRGRRTSAHGGSARAPRARSASVASLPPPGARRASRRSSSSGRAAAVSPLPSGETHHRDGQNQKARSRNPDSPRGRGAAAAATDAHRTPRSRTRGGKRPVRFPPTNSGQVPPRSAAERGRDREDLARFPAPHGAASNESFAEAAATARAARSGFNWISDEFTAQRLAVMAGGGLAVVAAAVLLGIKLFSSHAEPVRPTPPAVVHAEQSSPAINALVAQTEAAFTADDFAVARADVDKLRALSPQHPRLAFFEKLLSQQADNHAKNSGAVAAKARSSRTNSQHPAASDQPAVSARPAPGAPAPVVGHTQNEQPAPVAAAGTAATATAGAATTHDPASSAPASAPVPEAAEAAAAAGAAPVESAASPATSPAPAPAAPGSTPAPAATTAATPTQPATAAPASDAKASGAAPTTGAEVNQTSAPAAATPAAATAAAARPPASGPKANSGEPPPVIREARLVKRVAPDYPGAARKQNLSGSVDLTVTVSGQGNVEDAKVISASPPDLFEKAALAAVRKWKYEPRYVDGLPAQAQLTVHLDFAP